MVRSLEAWLREKGFTDLFVDYANIDAGEKWAWKLRDAAGACRVVVCLVTDNWLASDECFGEFKAAWYMGKRIISLFALPRDEPSRRDRLANVQAEDQGIDVVTCRTADGGLDLARDAEIENRLEKGLRAGGALAKVGLDPEAFAVDRKLRPMPFPGLASFSDEDADAALFYGRSREIAEALEELRKVRAEGDLRPFVILGASGAGKSSLMKAGIIPRLRREAPAWLPLRAFRPGGDPLLNLAEAIAKTRADFGSTEAHGIIRDNLLYAWVKARAAGMQEPAGRVALSEALEAEGRKLREAAGRPDATILISVDQAEELARADGDSGDALAGYLHTALNLTASRWQLAFTTRTDSFAELQHHYRFQDLKGRVYDLRAVPAFQFVRVIEEPAERYGVRVDPALVAAVIEDAPRENALPLLAFGLQRLWRQFAASGALTPDNYIRVGRLGRLIEDGAERALRGLSPDEDVALPPGPPPKSRLDLAAATFVPALTQLNEQRATIARIANWTSFTDEQRDLLALFVQWRLVVHKGDPGTVEVAHEALFREWKRLERWLEPERARLEILRSLQADALTWNQNGRDVAFLNHRSKRLVEASALQETERYRERLSALEFDYLAACGVANAAELRRARRVRAAIGALAVVLIAVVTGWMKQDFVFEQWNWFAKVRPYRVANFDGHALSPERERTLRPGDHFRECGAICPEMVVVQAGEFWMGSPDGSNGPAEVGRAPVEGPRHQVRIARQFAVGKNEVRFDEWDECVKVGVCPANKDYDMGRGRKPVVGVSFDDAANYVRWLALMTGKQYRLLSESEWEYSERAGTETAYFWGPKFAEGNANCRRCGPKWNGKYETSPVEWYPANAFGLYDMAGNVWQWVEDCYQETYDGAPSDGRPWMNKNCGNRVVRGGGWFYDPEELRSAARGNAPVSFQVNYIGFRVARTIAP